MVKIRWPGDTECVIILHFVLSKDPNKSSSVWTTSVKLKELKCLKRITWVDAFMCCSLQYTWVPLMITSGKRIVHFFWKNVENRLAEKEKQEKKTLFCTSCSTSSQQRGWGAREDRVCSQQENKRSAEHRAVEFLSTVFWVCCEFVLREAPQSNGSSGESILQPWRKRKPC